MKHICVIGSGPGGGPIALELAKAGHKVTVLEKGPWVKTDQFNKDQIAVIMRDIFMPSNRDEPHVLEKKKDGEWKATSSAKSGKNFWNGSAVGGSSNFMSGYMHRMKPKDFRLVSEYGPIKGANLTDWPISYDDLEPYYAKTESVVGISGRVINHSHQEPRSTEDFPFPELETNVVSEMLENAAEQVGYEMMPVPRAIISRPKDDRKACYYSNYCGSYGCFSGAKGNARVAVLNEALVTGNCNIIADAKVFHLETNGVGKVVKAWYYDQSAGDVKQSIEADVFVVACQAIETSRLLLMSRNAEFPDGLANNSGNVGKNLIFSGGGSGAGYLYFKDLPENVAAQLKTPGLFVNRALPQWYEIDDPKFGGRAKGGVIDFLFEHANGMPIAIRKKWDGDRLVFGSELKQRLHRHFHDSRRLRFEVFNDWLPNDDCFVTLDPKVTDKWGDPVARIRLGYHERDIEVGEYLAERASNVMKALGAKGVGWGISGNPPANLQAGGCRFGNDPATSVLDPNCKAHEVENLYVTDGSFIPTGGSATYTWTIYANSFRVADHLKEVL